MVPSGASPWLNTRGSQAIKVDGLCIASKQALAFIGEGATNLEAAFGIERLHKIACNEHCRTQSPTVCFYSAGYVHRFADHREFKLLLGANIALDNLAPVVVRLSVIFGPSRGRIRCQCSATL